MRHHDAIMQGVQEGGLFLAQCEAVATVSSALPRMLGSAGGEILGAAGGLSGKGSGVSGINEASETAGGASGIEGASKTAGGQVYDKSCTECATEIAKQRGLPYDFPAKTGTFNPMYEKYKGQDFPTHVAVRNPDGTITDTTILQNIAGYSDHQLPSDLQKYNDTDTFTEPVYDQLITRFYDAWKAKQ